VKTHTSLSLNITKSF